MAYNYFAQYQGQRVSPLPQGYMEAATAPGRNLAAGIAAAGEGIGNAIANYRRNKDEDAFATAKLESYFSGPQEQSLEYAGIVGEKLMKKFEEGKATRTDKLAMLNTLDTYSDRRIKEAQAAQADYQRSVTDQMSKLPDVISAYAAPTMSMSEATPAQTQQISAAQLEQMLSAAKNNTGYYPNVSREDIARFEQYQAAKAAYDASVNPATGAPVSQPAGDVIDWNYGNRMERNRQSMLGGFDPTSRYTPPSLANQLAADAMRQPPPVMQNQPQPLRPPAEPTFTQTVKPAGSVERQVPLTGGAERRAFVDYLRGSGITDGNVIMEALRQRDIGSGAEVRDLGNGIGGLYIDGQFKDVIQPKGMSETDLKIRTMTIDLPGISPPAGADPGTAGLGAIQGVASSAEEAVKLREKYSEATKMVISLDQLLEYANKGQVLNPADRAKVEGLIADVIGASRLAVLGPGVMTKEEREWLGSLIGNPNDIVKFSSATKSKLNRMRQSTMNGVAAYAQSIGLKVGGQGSGQGGNGPQRTVINVEDLKGY